MSLLEIYNDKLRDLMLPPTAPPPAKELAIREDHEGTICVPGLTEKAIEVHSRTFSLAMISVAASELRQSMDPCLEDVWLRESALHTPVLFIRAVVLLAHPYKFQVVFTRR